MQLEPQGRSAFLHHKFIAPPRPAGSSHDQFLACPQSHPSTCACLLLLTTPPSGACTAWLAQMYTLASPETPDAPPDLPGVGKRTWFKTVDKSFQAVCNNPRSLGCKLFRGVYADHGCLTTVRADRLHTLCCTLLSAVVWLLFVRRRVFCRLSCLSVCLGDGILLYAVCLMWLLHECTRPTDSCISLGNLAPRVIQCSSPNCRCNLRLWSSAGCSLCRPWCVVRVNV